MVKSRKRVDQKCSMHERNEKLVENVDHEV
jgi:hypothetical protein